MSSNPAGRVSREFSAKNTPTSMKTGGRWLVAASPEIFFLKNFAIIFGFFSHFHFAECKSLSSAFSALGKEAFVVKGYVDSSLPSAALGKARVSRSGWSHRVVWKEMLK